jgi:hypothetical protein
LGHDLGGGAHRNGEADAQRTAAGRQDGRVDADQAPGGVDERAAGVAGIDRGIGLDEVLEGVDTDPVAAGAADDALGDGLPHSERVADCEDDVADLHAVGVAEGDRLQVLRVDLEHREIGFRIGADYFGPGRRALTHFHRHRAGALDDVVVRQHIAVGAHQHARAEAAAALLLRRAERP